MSTENKSLAVTENKFEVILDRIVRLEETGVQFPKDYSPENAARSAWLILQETKDKGGKAALEVCTPNSVANAMLKMVTLGLNPIKKQCYFLVYGNKLECQPSYQGSIATAKRFGLKAMHANIIYKGDQFEYSITPNGLTVVSKHIQTLESLAKEILGVYAVANMEDGSIDTTIMIMEDIKKAWNQGPMNGNSPAHKNFPGEMSKKTVINRACKTIINSSDDAGLYGDDDEPKASPTEAHVSHQIAEKANKESIGFEEEETEDAGYQEVASNEDEENQREYEAALAAEESTGKGPGF
jgi:recombination protein RecT